MAVSGKVVLHPRAAVLLCSFAGIGLAKGPVSKLVDKVHQSRNARDRWRRAKVLIIDEVSMLDGELFDKLEYIGRAMRQDRRPFGGIQVILSGEEGDRRHALVHDVWLLQQ